MADNLEALLSPCPIDPGRHLEDDDRGGLGASEQLAVGRRDRDGPLFRRVSPARRPRTRTGPTATGSSCRRGMRLPVLYAALAEAGYFPHDQIMTLRKLGSPLEGHPNMKRLAGVEASTGSLGPGAVDRRGPRPGRPDRQERHIIPTY